MEALTALRRTLAAAREGLRQPGCPQHHRPWKNPKHHVPKAVKRPSWGKSLHRGQGEKPQPWSGAKDAKNSPQDPETTASGAGRSGLRNGRVASNFADSPKTHGPSGNLIVS